MSESVTNQEMHNASAVECGGRSWLSHEINYIKGCVTSHPQQQMILHSNIVRYCSEIISQKRKSAVTCLVYPRHMLCSGSYPVVDGKQHPYVSTNTSYFRISVWNSCTGVSNKIIN